MRGIVYQERKIKHASLALSIVAFVKPLGPEDVSNEVDEVDPPSEEEYEDEMAVAYRVTPMFAEDWDVDTPDDDTPEGSPPEGWERVYVGTCASFDSQEDLEAARAVAALIYERRVPLNASAFDRLSQLCLDNFKGHELVDADDERLGSFWSIVRDERLSDEHDCVVIHGIFGSANQRVLFLRRESASPGYLAGAEERCRIFSVDVPERRFVEVTRAATLPRDWTATESYLLSNLFLFIASERGSAERTAFFASIAQDSDTLNELEASFAGTSAGIWRIFPRDALRVSCRDITDERVRLPPPGCVPQRDGFHLNFSSEFMRETFNIWKDRVEDQSSVRDLRLADFNVPNVCCLLLANALMVLDTSRKAYSLHLTSTGRIKYWTFSPLHATSEQVAAFLSYDDNDNDPCTVSLQSLNVDRFAPITAKDAEWMHVTEVHRLNEVRKSRLQCVSPKPETSGGSVPIRPSNKSDA